MNYFIELFLVQKFLQKRLSYLYHELVMRQRAKDKIFRKIFLHAKKESPGKSFLFTNFV